MSCSRFQFELSQCLDGRLPSARRAKVMAHVDRCPTCTQVWEEMQAAQSLVLGLEEARVGSGFRDAVWNRIHAGEGAPEILLAEPITFAAKVRYGLVGAAAAAVLLFGVRLLTTDGAAETEITPETDEVAVTELPEARKMPGPVVQDFQTQSLSTAAHLANQTVEKVAGAAKRLRLRRRMILENPPQAEASFWQEARNDVRVIDGGLIILQTLRRKGLARLEGDARDCMVRAQTTLDHYRKHRFPNTPRDVQVLVRSLDQCPLDGLANKLTVTLPLRQLNNPGSIFFEMYEDPHFRRLVEELRLIPNGFRDRVLRLQFHSFSAPPGMDPMQRLRPAPTRDEDRKLRKR